MGIALGSGFTLQSSQPIDERLQFKTITEMRDAEETSLYDGLMSFCVEADSVFIWKTKNPVSPEFGKWSKFTSGSGGEQGSFVSVDYYEAMKESGTLDTNKFYYVSDEFIDEQQAEDKIVLNESSYDALAEAGKLNENTTYYVY